MIKGISTPFFLDQKANNKKAAKAYVSKKEIYICKSMGKKEKIVGSLILHPITPP